MNRMKMLGDERSGMQMTGMPLNANGVMSMHGGAEMHMPSATLA